MPAKRVRAWKIGLESADTIRYSGIAKADLVSLHPLTNPTLIRVDMKLTQHQLFYCHLVHDVSSAINRYNLDTLFSAHRSTA